MSGWRFIFRSLRHYWRTNLCILFGLTIATAVITGSLLVGDSMSGSLLANALSRIGNIDQVLVAPHFFRAALAKEIAADPALSGKITATAALLTPGSAQAAENDWRIPNVSVIGIDPDFWNLFPQAIAPQLPADHAVINQSLAADLRIKVGDDILIRMDRMGPVGDNVLFARRRREDSLRTLRLTVTAILPAGSAGDFSLDAQTSAPRNVFLSREALAKSLDQPDLANAILTQTNSAPEVLQSALARHCTLADYGLKLVRSDEGGYVAVESSTILLTQTQIETAKRIASDLHATPSPASAYLATQIAKTGTDHRSIAYTIIAGLADAPAWHEIAGKNVGDDVNGIMLNNWAAEDLHATVGDELEITYLVPTADGLYKNATIRLKLCGIVELSGPAADRHLTPDLNGLTDSKRINQWKLPFPIEQNRITRRDDEYWNAHGPTPKAFVSLQTMQNIWASASSHAGSDYATAMRLIPPSNTHLATFEPTVAAEFAKLLLPAQGQMSFRPLRTQLANSAGGSTDFGQLFFAMSFFLVIAAAAMAGMFMRLLAQQRAGDIGIMLACGWRGRGITTLALVEGGILAIIAAIIGLPAGIAYNWMILHAIDRWWISPWGHPHLQAYVTGASLTEGAVSGIVIGLVCTFWAMKALRRVSVLQLISGRQAIAMVALQHRWLILVPTILAVAGLALLASASQHAIATDMAFFGGGTCLLAAALSAIWVGFGRWLHRGREVVSLMRLAIRNAAANRARSMLTIGLLACASFIMMAVAANRRDFSQLDVSNRASGAGGFTLRATTSVPLHFDLASAAGRANLGFSTDDEKVFAGVTVVPLSESLGDDVSCLNLNKPMQPRLLGVTSSLAARDAFTVLQVGNKPEENPWRALERGPDADGVIPAFGDADSVEWILHSGLGQVYAFPGPDGKPVRLRIVGVIPGSIFAGELLISQENLHRIYPEVNGASYFLFAATPGQQDRLTNVLRVAMSDYGVEVRTTREILNSFVGVQNIYLSIFMTLGGLGLLLGTAGMVAVIARSTLERRGELALMSAAGFTRARLVLLIVLENAGLLITGLLCGSGAALLAVAPAIASAQNKVSWSSLAIILASVTAAGLLWCIIPAHFSIGLAPSRALREE